MHSFFGIESFHETKASINQGKRLIEHRYILNITFHSIYNYLLERKIVIASIIPYELKNIIRRQFVSPNKKDPWGMGKGIGQKG
ncbi:hypothetical protein RJT34_29525 [Clitoria ternatea]|uniref:Uncharacterized protein n=1 Tax=Clitoria ternatea TaxID=43366 RepID=A0AAN9FGB1_CLITE